MATVYLPFGYPQLSGQEFANVIYQGTMVRLYTVPTDPRTDAQLQERRLLSDLSKMRVTLGTWGRGAMTTCLGSKWATILHQAIKADIEGFWSDAVEEWATFGSGNRQAWREAAPYQATFNDQGFIWFGLVRMLYRIMNFFKGITFLAEEWDENESADAETWWNKSRDDAIQRGKYDQNNALVNYLGSWATETQSGAYGGTIKTATAGTGAEVNFYCYGFEGIIGVRRGDPYGIVRVEQDNTDLLDYDLDQENYPGYPDYFRIWAGGQVKGLHFVRYSILEGLGNIDYVEVY